ncbi:MAG: methylated-DNA--[protein]-cysteine S-methyltransferase [Bacillota bacterium]|jgi:methylated-DNA-[protein]-cysteine S-methyltransferase
MYYSTIYPSPLGLITLACNGDNLVGLWIKGQKHYGKSIPENLIEKDNLPVFIAAKNWLDSYFAGENPAISALSLSPKGSDFRQKVWSLLCEIPYGQTTTYGEIAKKVALKLQRPSMSSQAVGGAVGHNPLSIIIPCHRVVGSDGSLTGYAGGLKTKIKLLELEGADMSKLFIPKKGTAL